MFKKITLIIVLIICTNVFAYAETDITDIEGHWAEEIIKQLINDDIVSGYPDHTFRPDSPITVREFIVLLSKISFEDHEWKSWQDDWSFQFMNIAIDHDFVEHGDFHSYDSYVTREGIAKLMIRALGLEPISGKTNFVDDQYISLYKKAYVNVCVNLELFGGYPNGEFKGYLSASRAEVCVMLQKFRPYAKTMKPNANYTEQYITKTYSVDLLYEDELLDDVYRVVTKEGSASIVNKELNYIITRNYNIDIAAGELIPYPVDIEDIIDQFFSRTRKYRYVFDDEEYAAEVIRHHLEPLYKPKWQYSNPETPNYMEDQVYVVLDELQEIRKDWVYLLEGEKFSIIAPLNFLEDYFDLRMKYLYSIKADIGKEKMFEDEFDFMKYYYILKDMYGNRNSFTKGEFIIRGSGDIRASARTLIESLPDHDSVRYNQSLAYGDKGYWSVFVYGTMDDYIIMVYIF